MAPVTKAHVQLRRNVTNRLVRTSGYAKNGFTCVSRFPALLTRLPRSRETRRMRVGTHLKSHRSSCRPRDTRRRLKTFFFGTFLRPRNASRARDSACRVSSKSIVEHRISRARLGKNLRAYLFGNSARENRRKRGGDLCETFVEKELHRICKKIHIQFKIPRYSKKNGWNFEAISNSKCRNPHGKMIFIAEENFSC